MLMQPDGGDILACRPAWLDLAAFGVSEEWQNAWAIDKREELFVMSCVCACDT